MDGHSGETAPLAAVHRDQANGPVADVYEPVALSVDRHTKVRVPPYGITGPLPSTFAISSFAAPASTSTAPTLRTVTLDELVRLLTTHDRRRNKDGRGWSGATYKPGTTRKNENVVEWSVAAGDFDHFSMDGFVELRDRITGFGLAGIYYSTYNSTDDDFRFRAAIPLTKPVPAARYGEVWRQINAHIFDGRNDPQTKDPSRMLYTPAAPKDVATVAEYISGQALDWEKLPPVPISWASPSTNGTMSAGQDVGIGRETLHFLAFGAEVGHQRGTALRATRSLLAAGKSVEETADKVWQGLRASPVGDETTPWTYEQALAIVEDLAKREPTPLEERPWVRVSDGRAPHPSDGGFSASDVLPNGAASTPSANGHAASVAAHSPQVGPPQTAGATAPARTFQQTEMGLAEFLVRRHGEALRYCHPWGSWLEYTDGRWKRDLTGGARRRAKETIRSVYAFAAEVEDKEKRLALIDFARRSERSATVGAVLKLAEAEPGIPILPEEMDADPFVLNVLNGTVDLRTGRLRPHDPLDYITKLAPVAFDPEATAPTFHAFMECILPDPDVRGFLQRMTGYSLTGDTSEQCLAFLHGGGANGKSTFIAVLQAMLGDYAKQAAPELLVSRGGDHHPTELADLFGARLVASVEVDEGKRLAETLVKQMTGGDRMKARFMRGDFFEWTPTHKLFLAANHRPEIRGTDYAIWRRIHLVPFTVTIPEGERDLSLLGKLRAELSGILNWGIEGCLAWQRDGLGVPQAVRDATAEYRAEQDGLADFLADRCVEDPRAWATAGDLYQAYLGWCGAAGVAPLSSQGFGRRLTERDFLRGKRDVPGHRVRVWTGLGLLAPPDGRSPDAIGPSGRIRTGFSG